MTDELDPRLVRLAAAPFHRARYIARVERLLERYRLSLAHDQSGGTVMKMLYEHPSALLEQASIDRPRMEERLEAARLELANLRAAAPLPPPPDRTERSLVLAFADLENLLFEMRAIRRASRRVPPEPLLELYRQRSRDPLEPIDADVIRAIVRVPRGHMLRACTAIVEVRWGVLDFRRQLAPPRPKDALGPVRACSTGEVIEGFGRRVEAFGRTIAIFRDRGALYAIDDTCPHRGGPLHQGDVEKGAAVCPLHGWAFDLATGCMRGSPKIRVPTYDVEVEGDDVFVGPPRFNKD